MWSQVALSLLHLGNQAACQDNITGQTRESLLLLHTILARNDSSKLTSTHTETIRVLSLGTATTEETMQFQIMKQHSLCKFLVGLFTLSDWQKTATTSTVLAVD